MFLPIDHFTEEQFRAALPKKPPCVNLGVVGGEYCYLLPVQGSVYIYIRSSVGPSGTNADCGEDSIRCWLVGKEYKPLAPKVSKYITRVTGWEKRLTATLRVLYKLGLLLTECPHCKQQLFCGSVKDKSKPTFGRLFVSCSARCEGSFQWVDARIPELEVRKKK